MDEVRVRLRNLEGDYDQRQGEAEHDVAERLDARHFVSAMAKLVFVRHVTILRAEHAVLSHKLVQSIAFSRMWRPLPPAVARREAPFRNRGCAAV